MRWCSPGKGSRTRRTWPLSARRWVWPRHERCRSRRRRPDRWRGTRRRPRIDARRLGARGAMRSSDAKSASAAPAPIIAEPDTWLALGDLTADILADLDQRRPGAARFTDRRKLVAKRLPINICEWSIPTKGLILLAGAPGFEPGMAESKSAALPLGYAPAAENTCDSRRAPTIEGGSPPHKPRGPRCLAERNRVGAGNWISPACPQARGVRIVCEGICPAQGFSICMCPRPRALPCEAHSITPSTKCCR